jgi:REP element-mobilizing transposase RayT
MRQARLKNYGKSDCTYFHCLSRVVNRDFVLEDAEREQFVEYMRLYERYCGVRVLTFCVMSNHFHILLAVPNRPEVMPTDAELVEVLRGSMGEVMATVLADDLKRARASASPEWAEEIRERHLKRMWDVSQFMKTLKQRFTQWFNKRHQRKGTLWEERFRSVLVEGVGTPLAAMATYIDLNPVRAEMVEDPMDYRWCGYGAAVGGDVLAQAGMAEVVHAVPTANTDGLEPLDGYRVLLYGRGVERGLTPEGEPMKKGFSREAAKQVIAEGGRLDRLDYVRCRVRYFSDGAVIGSREFVNGVFEAVRERFTPKRKDGARRLAGLNKADGLYALRDLRVDRLT